MKGLDSQTAHQIALVGMDLMLDTREDLDRFERNIYEGRSLFQTSKSSPKALTEERARVSIKDIRINLLNSRLDRRTETQKSRNQAIFKVANNALRDAKLSKDLNVAIIITAQQDNIDQSGCTELANDLCNLWSFTGRLFTLPAGENSVFKALEAAQRLLVAREVDTVLVCDVAFTRSKSGGGVGAVVLKRLETATQKQNRIYAQIDAISVVQTPASRKGDNGLRSPDAEAVQQTCQQAFKLAKVEPTAISYLEICGGRLTQENEAEIKGLLQAYRSSQSELNCALGSIETNPERVDAVPAIASLIKTALCLYYRYIPGLPQWNGPQNPELWQGSTFYVASESRPWFSHTEIPRTAAINSIGQDGICAHLILSEGLNQPERSSRYLEQTPFYLFPIAAESRLALLEQLHTLKKSITDCDSLSTIANQTFAIYQNHAQATYAIAILGRNKEQVLQEIERACKGIGNAFDAAKDWQTPVGSYFTAYPLGKKGKTAWVYPGGFNTYLGLGKDLFRLFPKLYDDPAIQNACSRVASLEKLIYPRSLKKLSNRKLENLEKQLIHNPLAMLESGTGFAGLMSAILRDYFQVDRQGAFGYSLGEISMMFSQGVWKSYHQVSNNLNVSPLFKTRLSGPKNTVREYWGLPQGKDNEGDFWSTYVLIADVNQVKERLKSEPRVYLTQINTCKEVVIAGDRKACQRIIESLNCDAFSAPFNHVIHCEAMRSEYNELVQLNTLPIENQPGIVFYSAAEYQPIVLESQSVAHSISQAICQQLDFPRLVNRVYQDGFKVFVEVGAGSNCSRWIDETLKTKEHVTVSLNRRGIDDHTSIVRALAKLLSHRVELNLSPLYLQPEESLSRELTAKTMEEENRVATRNQHNLDPISKPSEHIGNAQKNQTLIPSSYNEVDRNYFVNPLLTSSHVSQCKKLMYNASGVNQTHAHFLKVRQETIRALSQIIQVQMSFVQKVITQSQAKKH